MRFLCWILPIFACACTVDEPKQAAARPATTPFTNATYATHAEPELGLRFPLATTGTTFKMWHFDPTLPSEKFRHEIQLSSALGVQVVIDVWDNPQHLDVRHWVDATIADLFNDQTKRTERPMSRAHDLGLLFEQPAIEGGTAQVMAAYVTPTRAYLFTCPQALEDTAGRAAFDAIVEDFEAEVTR